MATNTYVALKKTVVGTATGSVVFDSIPQGYTDLKLVVTCRGTTTAYIAPALQFNTDTSSGSTNYSWTAVFGDGSSAISYRVANQASISGEQAPRSNDSANLFSAVTFDLLNYSNATTNKTVLITNDSKGATCVSLRGVGTWRNTAAINTITITSGTPNFEVGSTFTLYGVAAEGTAIAPKATGGAIYSDTLYYYHVFGSTGVFTPSTSLSADVLVVAGGGGGGAEYGQGQACSGGGGGAGGLLGFTSQSLTATNYAVTVGAGGAGGAAGKNKGALGGDSQFGALTLVKGGGGGGYNYDGGGSTSGMAGLTGGSGGGAGGTYTGAYIGLGGSATSGQGYAGGGGTGTRSGGGGGGSGVAGTAAADNNIAGAGGNGVSTYSSWGVATGVGQNVNGTYYIAGGGGGGMWDTTNVTLGAGGYGGGASGNAYGLAGSNAVANTGGGGSGASASTSTSLAGGNGGSGVVIVRYLKA